MLDQRLPERRTWLSVVLVALTLASLSSATGAQENGFRIQTTAFGRRALIEILDLPSAEARAAVAEAQQSLAMIEASFDETEGNAAAQLSEASGGGPIKVAPVLFDLLLRSESFCYWSHGAHGPLAGDLYALWGIPLAVSSLPLPEDLQLASTRARCDRMLLHEPDRTVQLAEGSRLQLWGFSIGYAIDLAVDKLKEAGAGNGRIIVGRIARGFGLGPQGQGWPVDLPSFASLDGRKPRIFLRDASTAVISMEDYPISIAGESYPPYFDQRDGQPPKRMIATVTVTELAVDAQAVGVTLFVVSSQEGLAQLGQLRPSPSVLWVEGSRESDPLLMQHRWSLVPR